MAKVGYIFRANAHDSFDSDKLWMQEFGCVQVIEESVEHELLRPQWKQLMSNLERGDELVITKFSNAVRGLREMAAFIELCRIKVVRIISIHDEIDTGNKLFPNTTVGQVLEVFGALPEETAVLRRSSERIKSLRNIENSISIKKIVPKNEREKTIVAMYNNGYSLDDIWTTSGFSSKSSIWRILNKYGVKLNRGKTSGPRNKRKQGDNETEKLSHITVK